MSLAPELSLHTIGSEIPVVQLPQDLPCLSLKELAYLLSVAGNMVAHCSPAMDSPGETVRAYDKWKKALEFCNQTLAQAGGLAGSSGALGSQG